MKVITHIKMVQQATYTGMSQLRIYEVGDILKVYSNTADVCDIEVSAALHLILSGAAVPYWPDENH